MKKNDWYGINNTFIRITKGSVLGFQEDNAIKILAYLTILIDIY